MKAQFSKPNAIIVDIEGTTTDCTYFSRVLLPFIKTYLTRFLNDTWDQRDTKDVIKSMRNRTKSDSKTMPKIPKIKSESKGREAIIESLNKNVLWLMDKKHNTRELKTLEILLWLWGYEKKYIKGHIYGDAVKGMHKWRTKLGIRLFTYTSGMVTAIKLLFACSNHGNVYILIDKFFDQQTIGKKTDAESYKKIANIISTDINSIMFITDKPIEAKAAKNAGCVACLIRRKGNKYFSEKEVDNISVIDAFTDIKFSNIS